MKSKGLLGQVLVPAAATVAAYYAIQYINTKLKAQAAA